MDPFKKSLMYIEWYETHSHTCYTCTLSRNDMHSHTYAHCHTCTLSHNAHSHRHTHIHTYTAEAFTSVTTKWGGAEAPSSPLDPPLQCKCVYVCVCVSVHCVTVCMCDSVHMCESACHCVTVCMCNMYESEFRTIQYT